MLSYSTYIFFINFLMSFDNMLIWSYSLETLSVKLLNFDLNPPINGLWQHAYQLVVLSPPDTSISLQCNNNGRNGISNHQPHHCLLIGLFRRRSKKTSKLRVTGLCGGNSQVTGEFPAERASTAETFPFHDVIMLMSHANQTHWLNVFHNQSFTFLII